MIETKIWERDREKSGLRRCVGSRKVVDVFNELSDTLKASGLLPDEYLNLDSDFKKCTEFPELLDMCCYAQWGSSEGIYLYVIVTVCNEKESSREQKVFAVGKTLSEDSAGYDRMQYIAGCIYKLFMGENLAPTRYMLMPKEKTPGREDLMKKLEQEYREMAARIFFSQEGVKADALSEFSLKGKILSVLPDCLLPDEKIDDLMKEEDALNTLYRLCQNISECDAFEINDMISSCRKIADSTVSANDEESQNGQ